MGFITHFLNNTPHNLIENLKQGQFNSYFFTIARKVKEDFSERFTVLDDNLYYEVITSKLADFYDRHKESYNLKSYYQFQQRITMDYITIEELLETIEETYSGMKLTKKD